MDEIGERKSKGKKEGHILHLQVNHLNLWGAAW